MDKEKLLEDLNSINSNIVEFIIDWVDEELLFLDTIYFKCIIKENDFIESDILEMSYFFKENYFKHIEKVSLKYGIKPNFGDVGNCFWCHVKK